MANSFYVDSCIYLNLWQKEEDKKQGILYWKLVKEFFEKIDNENSIIYYSVFLLKKLRFILPEEEYNKKRKLFELYSKFIKITISKEEFTHARKIESELKYKISFFDIIHMLLSKKSNSILITRDRKLLEAAKKYSVIARKPEDYL
jgi:predicted nucleic acid-binding protein